MTTTEPLPADVCRLVIAARIVAFEDQGREALRELDQASEAFASRVPWDDEPVEFEPSDATERMAKILGADFVVDGSKPSTKQARDLAERVKQISAFGNICPSEQHFLAQASTALRSLADEVERLTGDASAKSETYRQMHEVAVELGYPSILEALEALTALTKERDALREALTPFGDVADEYDDREDDRFEVWKDAGPVRTIRATFELRKYRAARAALNAGGEW